MDERDAVADAPHGKSAWLEERTRVTFFLPSATGPERAAMRRVVGYLRQQHRAAPPITGFTYGEAGSGAFHGLWWGRRDGASSDTWVHDRVALFIVDFEGPPGNPNIRGSLVCLRAAILEAYQATGAAQDDVWIVVDGVRRLAAE